MRRIVSFYTTVARELYRRGYSQTLLKCADGRRVQMVIEEVLKGIYGNHVGSWVLAAKILRVGYFGPTMKQDYLKFVRRYDKCQRLGELKHPPSKQLHYLEVSWPFHK